MPRRQTLLLPSFLLISLPATFCLADPATIQVWVDRAVTAANEIQEPEPRSFAHYHLARVLSRHGNAELALAAARQVTNPLRQLYALKYVAEAARKAGDEVLCREVVAVGEPAAMKDPGAFINPAYIDVCFAAGLPQAALKFADTHSAYLKIVEAYCATGNHAAAERLLRDQNLGEQGRLSMAQGYVEADDVLAALGIIESLADSDLADRGYVSVATALAHAGGNSRARKYVARIKDEALRRRTAGEIARFYTKDDSLEDLRREFAAASSREVKSGMLPLVVEKLCEAGEFSEADQAIDLAAAAISQDPLPVVSSKFGAYGDKSAIALIRGQHLTIAQGLIDSGEQDRAAVHVAKAAVALDDVSEAAALVKWPLQPAIVEAQLALNREDEAIDTMEKITGPSARAQAAARIAIHRINAGKIEDGLKLASGIAGDRTDGSEIGDIALALLRAAGLEKATDYLNQLESSERGAGAVTQVARKLTETNNLDQLRDVYAALESPSARAHFAMEAATRMLSE